ncbi:hypothetical protein VTO73DRAFT_10682 [Trametes versicolor]
MHTDSSGPGLGKRAAEAESVADVINQTSSKMFGSSSGTPAAVPQVTDAEARLEALENYRPVLPQTTFPTLQMPQAGGARAKQPRKDSGSSSSSKKNKKSDKAVYEKLTSLGSLLIHPGGLLRKGDGAPATDLRVTEHLSVDQQEELGEYGMFLTEDPEHQDGHLHFNQTWSPEAVDAWVRRLAPKLFAYMDARYGVRMGPGREEFHWVLARRNRGMLVRVRKPTAVNGADLHRVRGTGRSVNHYAIFLVTRDYIPPAIYRDFDEATAGILDGTLNLNDPRFSDRPGEDSPQSEPDVLDEDKAAEMLYEESSSSSSSEDEDPTTRNSNARYGGLLVPRPATPQRQSAPMPKGKGKARAIVLSSDEETVEQRGPLTRARAAKTVPVRATVGQGGEPSRKRARSESTGRDVDGESAKAKRVRLEAPAHAPATPLPSSSGAGTSRALSGGTRESLSPMSKYYLDRAARGLRSPGKLKRSLWD